MARNESEAVKRREHQAQLAQKLIDELRDRLLQVRVLLSLSLSLYLSLVC
jgi:hypothetical protein